MPPISRLASITMGFICECRSSSRAAVSPAGPAPMMIALPFFIWVRRSRQRYGDMAEKLKMTIGQCPVWDDLGLEALIYKFFLWNQGLELQSRARCYTRLG